MGLNENSKRYDWKGRLKLVFEFQTAFFIWAYLGAAKMPVWFSRNKTVKPVK